MSQQSVLSPRVHVRIRELFSTSDHADVAAMLLQYSGYETERIWLDILQLCRANLERVRELVDLANKDYRDVIAAAEYECFPDGSLILKQPMPPAVWINGVERNREAPKTFHIPTFTERTTARIGDFVKIGVESEESGERFWVEIVSRLDDGRYVGSVDNELNESWGFERNDHVIFEPQHILATR